MAFAAFYIRVCCTKLLAVLCGNYRRLKKECGKVTLSKETFIYWLLKPILL
jgi:hypothetical protein